VSGEDSVHGQGWRIAALPFRSLGAPMEGGLSLGMAEEISAAMARFRMPRLVATSSFWDGSGPVADALARSRAYRLDYVISGTIQASGPRIRVTVTLRDVAMNFEVMWASRFEGATDDLFSLQDRVASHTVAQIDPELLQRHQFRGDVPRTGNAQAHRAVLSAIQSIYRPDRDRFMQAGTLLATAVELDPGYAAAYAWLAYWHIMAVGQGWAEDPYLSGMQAGAAAEKAVALDPLDARGLAIAGHVKAYMMHDVETALGLLERAVALNPNLPIAWTLSAWSRVYAGQHEDGVSHADTAIALSPSDPHIFFPEQARAMGLLFLRELDEADRMLSSVLELKPGHASAIRVRTAVLGHLGRLGEAAAMVEALRAIEPGVTATSIARRPPLREEDRLYYIEGLLRAGLKEA
jgi:TolB-like protein